MLEENEQILQELNAPVAESVPEASDIEKKASSNGWRPKEEFFGNPDDWVEADEYIKRGSFFRKIDSLNRKIDERDKVIKAINETLSKSEERAYKRAFEDLSRKKQEAKSLGDIQAFENITKQEQELYIEKATALQALPQNPPADDPLKSVEFQAFAAKNPWINKTDEDSMILKQTATGLAQRYENDHPKATLEEVFNYVHSTVRKKMPHLLQDEPSQAARVSGNTLGKPTHSPAVDRASLDSAQKLVLEYLEKTKQDTSAYLKEIKNK